MPQTFAPSTVSSMQCSLTGASGFVILRAASAGGSTTSPHSSKPMAAIQRALQVRMVARRDVKNLVREQPLKLALVVVRLRQHDGVRARVAGAALLLAARLDEQDRLVELGQQLRELRARWPRTRPSAARARRSTTRARRPWRTRGTRPRTLAQPTSGARRDRTGSSGRRNRRVRRARRAPFRWRRARSRARPRRARRRARSRATRRSRRARARRESDVSHRTAPYARHRAAPV